MGPLLLLSRKRERGPAGRIKRGKRGKEEEKDGLRKEDLTVFFFLLVFSLIPRWVSVGRFPPPTPSSPPLPFLPPSLRSHDICSSPLNRSCPRSPPRYIRRRRRRNAACRTAHSSSSSSFSRSQDAWTSISLVHFYVPSGTSFRLVLGLIFRTE